MAISTKKLRDSLKNIGSTLKSSVADVLTSSDFISRTIGMNNSYEDIMFIVQALGREPVSLLGKDYAFIYDHVRRNYEQGTSVPSMLYGTDTSATGDEYSCAKFTFYKERPTIRFADPYTDPMNLLARWETGFKLKDTKSESTGYHYAESQNDNTTSYNTLNNVEGNHGTASDFSVRHIESDTCDLVRKTNDNFRHGKYRTLIARFHTGNDEDSRSNNPTQTAVSNKYGMSHGRNLLRSDHDKTKSSLPHTINPSYDNPYCRVWTYHHQYNRMLDAIRPFDEISAEGLEEKMMGSEYGKGGFRTIGDKQFDGGSTRLDKHGVLNYENGFVNIAPTAKIENYYNNNADSKDDKTVPLKRCMFSIENLAWKGGKTNRANNEYDPDGLSAEQKGPFGGRIMWFPPYDLTFNETTTAQWNPNQFIGRGEKIYTYTDTERRGSLSFTLLIDHPSVVDYWKRRKEEPGNEGVDNVESKEQELLRFFAGCSILTAKPQMYTYKEPVAGEYNEPEKEPEPKVENSEPPIEKADPISHKLYCFAFYPNNYSGKDDRDNGIVNPIHYLLNGIGTQKIVSDLTKDAIDFKVDMKEKLSGAGSGYGGYEMRNDKGISLNVNPLTPDYSVISGTYADVQSKERKAQYFTDNSGNQKKVWYGSVEPPYSELAKQIGDKALSLGNAKGNQTSGVSRYVTDKPYEWYRRRWYYRVDEETANQRLNGNNKIRENYIDSKSYNYNSDGIYNCLFLQSEFGINLEDTDDVVSLTDMYLGLEDSSISGSVFSDVAYNENYVKLIKGLKNDNKKYTINKITFYGHASVQGNNPSKKVNDTRNNDLAKNRALTFKNWMQKAGFPGLDKAEIEYRDGVQKSGDENDVNDPVTKFWRSASVVIEYDESNVESAQNTDSKKDVNSVALPKPTTETQTFDINNIDFSASKILTGQYVEKKKEVNFVEETTPQHHTPGTADLSILKNNVSNDGNRAAKKGINEINNTLDNRITYTEKTDYVKRYDNEGEFFELLSKDSPFLHHLISEKIKYFDPAFHSISPEGFNARLTFLQQCTRQGPTVGNSDTNAMSAYNLAFGRPPVCILRVGDFYYTKIIINSISINYDQMQWDLNPEGIGVMPMFAKITLDFNFIGGSDLSGPIARLQNAVSFNYYANTSVYDDRAEIVEYGDDRTGKETKYKPFTYPHVEPTSKKSNKTDNN